jgi:RNA polymerase sigma-70 factor, ECF subfamily
LRLSLKTLTSLFAFYSEGFRDAKGLTLHVERAKRWTVSIDLAVDPTTSVLRPVSTKVVKTSSRAKLPEARWNMQADVWQWEPAFFAIYGISAEHVTPSGPALLALTHPDDVALVAALMHGAKRGEEFSLTHRIFRHDGFVRLINTTSSIRRNSKGQPSVLRAAVDVRGAWRPPLSSRDIPSASDGELMLCLRAQMPEAVLEAFQRHRNGMVRVVRHLDLAIDPEDIIQDVFEELFRKPQGFDARRGSLATYLSMHARSRCLDIGRSQKYRRRRESASERNRSRLTAVEDEALTGLSDLAVRAALAGLHPLEREPIELAYLGGFTYREVAVQLGIPEGTVKSRIRNGLLHLRGKDALGISTNL